MPPFLPSFQRLPATEDHQWRGYSTLLSMAEALSEFLSSPAMHGPMHDETYLATRGRSWTNEDLVIATMGSRGIDAPDRATFDAVSGKYDRRVLTFRQAFRACCVPYDIHGHRDWRDVDVQALRDCHGNFTGLQLPAWVNEMLMVEQIADHYDRLAEDLAVVALDSEIPF